MRAVTVAAPAARGNYLHWAWLVAGAVLFLSFGYTEMAGSDLWWHLAAGREILSRGSIFLVDPWSYTAAGEPWKNHEWLADIIYYVWASIGGVSSLVYWKWLVVVLSFGGLQRVLLRATGSHLASLLAATVALALAAPFIDLRPHLYTLLGFSLLLWLCWQQPPRTWQLMLLFLLWVNLHGGFIFGLMALAILVLPWRQPSWARLRQAVQVVALCAAVCLLNPDGVNVFILPLVYAFDAASPYRQLGEWLSPYIAGGIRSPLFFYAWPLGLAVAAGYVLPPLRRRLGVPWEVLALCLLTLAMAVTSRRFIPLFGMAMALLLAPVLALLTARLESARYQWGLWLVVVAVAVYRLAPYPLAAAPAFHYLSAEYSYPRDTLDMVAVNALSGPVFAYYNWGGYIHWRTDGALQVYIDGRANTLFDDATYLNYLDVLRGQPNWLSIVEDSGAQFFLWPLHTAGGGDKARQLWATGRWQLLYQDSVSYLMGRLPLAGAVRVPPASSYRQLTLAREYFYQGDFPAAIGAARAVLARQPYQREACTTLVAALRQAGKPRQAETSLAVCRAQFPSMYLR